MNFTNSHRRIVNATLCLSNLRYMYEISDKPLMLLCRVLSSAAMAKWSCVQVPCMNLLIGAGASVNTRVSPFEKSERLVSANGGAPVHTRHCFLTCVCNRSATGTISLFSYSPYIYYREFYFDISILKQK